MPGKTVYFNKQEEKRLQRALRTQMLIEYDKDNEKEGKKFEELMDKIAQTPKN
jgi:hypothetical protein